MLVKRCYVQRCVFLCSSKHLQVTEFSPPANNVGLLETVITSDFCPEVEQGFHASWKVLEFFCKISMTWKVLENDFGPGKSWKFKLKVLEFAGMRM